VDQSGRTTRLGRWTGGRRARPVAATVALVLAATTACSFGPPAPDQAGAPPRFATPSPSATEGGGEQEVVATVLAGGLEVPWGLAFLPDGAALVTERDTAKILQVGPDTDGDSLKVTEIQTLAEVEPGGEGGLMGIAVSPKYQTDKTVYVYYSTAKDWSSRANRGRSSPASPARPSTTAAGWSSDRTGSSTPPPGTRRPVGWPRTGRAWPGRSCG
jgi:glucose/arabinose dehydrogenase